MEKYGPLRFLYDTVVNPFLNLMNKSESRNPKAPTCDEDDYYVDYPSISSKSIRTEFSDYDDRDKDDNEEHENTIDEPAPLTDSTNEISLTATINELNSDMQLRPRYKHKKILIVEDHRISRKFLHQLLEKEGHYCEEAPNGLIGVNMVKATTSMNTEDLYLRDYDVILMDLMMPVMNGIDATRAIRQHGYKGPIIGVTAMATRPDEAEFYKAGTNLVVFKPFKINAMYEILNSL